jgi:hypothetical protein
MVPVKEELIQGGDTMNTANFDDSKNIINEVNEDELFLKKK